MLIYSMGVSLDGFIADRAGRFDWSMPDAELFRFHLDRVGNLGAYLIGRRLYEVMTVWETDPSLQGSDDEKAFARAWAELPKIVFSSSRPELIGNARWARSGVAEELESVRRATDKDVEIGGAGLAASAIELNLVDEYRIFRYPVIVGGGTPLLPPVSRDLSLQLIETRAFTGGVVYEAYLRQRS